MNIVRLPDIGASTGDAEVVVWLKHVGDSVTVGEALMEVQTDKANVEVEAPESGVLARVLVDEGQVVPVGAPLAVIAESTDELDADLIERASHDASAGRG